MFLEEMEEGASIAEVLNLLSGIVETSGIFVRRSVPVSEDSAEEIVDQAKCVTVVSSALQEVAMNASKAETRMEMKRVKVEWPCIHTRVEDLQGAIVKSMIPILHADRQLDELLVKNVFKVQKERISLFLIANKLVIHHITCDQIQ